MSEFRKVPMSECRDCGAPIRFVTVVTQDGKRQTALPVDPLPNDRGNVLARLIGNRLHGWVLRAGERVAPPMTRFMPHHATCPERPGPKPIKAEPATLF